MIPDKQLSLIEQARAEELKKHAVEFAKWATVNYRWIESVNGWLDMHGKTLTDDELYNLFNPPNP